MNLLHSKRLVSLGGGAGLLLFGLRSASPLRLPLVAVGGCILLDGLGAFARRQNPPADKASDDLHAIRDLTDTVDAAGEGSFPASDPPSWTLGANTPPDGDAV